MRCGQSVKFAGTVKMVPAVAGAAPAVLEKNIAANKFIVIKSGIIYHKWPPFWLQIKSIFGWNIFHLISKIYGIFNLYWVQSYIVCKK